MAVEEVDQELWELAVENIKKQQEEAFDGLFNQAVEEHLKGECRDCKDGLCARCEDWIVSGIENWQESKFDDLAEAEYDRLVEQQEEEKASDDEGSAMKTAEVDLHGYYPGDVENGLLTRIAQQAWEMGADELVLIHGHGHNRGISVGFVNTNTGFLGLTVRRTLKSDPALRQWIYHSTINRGDSGLTTVRLKPNAAPSRSALEL